MLHDLRAINQATTTQNNISVPDPYVALSSISPRQQFFTVIDLANAIFCLPLSEENRDMFSFTFEGHQYTHSRMPQGYKDIFNAALKKDLTPLHLPKDIIIIKYVDDLLLAAPTAEVCLKFTKEILTLLSKTGYKVKKEKTQIARKSVSFLGRMISGNSCSLSASQPMYRKCSHFLA